MAIDAKAYIKKMTSVPEKFIDEIFELYNESSTQSNFVIKLDAIAKWLSTTKQSIIRTLSRSYKMDFDYIITKADPNVQKKDPRNNNFKMYLLTPDCFKRLAMMSKSKNAEMVRTYYIEVENLFINFREQTLNGMQQQIDALARNMKPKKAYPPNQGFIYIIRTSDQHTLYKLGRTNDLNKRLKTYNTGLANDIDVLYLYETNDVVKVEKCVKMWLQDHRYRKYKEVYDVDLDTIKQIINNCGKAGATLTYKRPKQSTMNGGYFIVFSNDKDTK